MPGVVRGLTAASWTLLAAATAAALVLLRFPIQVFPAHDISVAALPVLALALLAGPFAGAIAAAATAVAATLLGDISPLLATLLAAAPLLGFVQARLAHPAYSCFAVPFLAALAAMLLAGPGVDRLHLLTVGLLEASISVIGAYGLALAAGARRSHRRGGWAGRPLTHRLFVTLATAATVLTVGLGVLSAQNLQERQVATTLANLRLLSQEIAESTQVLLRAHGRSLSAFGRSLVDSDLGDENDSLQARIIAYTAGQSELLTVLLARPDGEVIAAAANRPTLDVQGVLRDNVADRDYFRGAIRHAGPYVTDTFRGRGFGSDMIVAISAPVYRERNLAGVIEASLNLLQLAQVLDAASSRRGLDIVLVDRANRVVAARGTTAFATGDAFTRPASTYVARDMPQLRIRRLPPDARLAASGRLDPFGWTVHVAQPVRSLVPVFETQFRAIVRDMTITLLSVFVLSFLFAGVLARPLRQIEQSFTDASTGGSSALLSAVRASPGEIRRFALMLVRAQRRQGRSLRRQQQLVAEKDRLNSKLHELNVELDQKVEGRTRVLAERELQLRASETRWRTMAEIAPDAVVVIDEDNVIRFVNTAMMQLTKRTVEGLVGRYLDVIIPERLRHGHGHGLQRYLASRERRLNWRSTEALVLDRDGVEHPVEIAFGEFTLDGSHFFAGYLRDIAARKQHEAEVIRARDLAEAANRSKDSFLATMSHEIRTPLHGLIGTLDLMTRDEIGKQAEFRLRIARNSARSLLQIANDVLDLSGIEAGRVRIERVAFDLRDLVAAVSTAFEPGAVEKGLRLEHVIDADVPGWVEGDPLRLRQIITNLVNNAIKFTPRGRVWLSVHAGPGDSVVFDVGDTGIGVPHDKREHIFDRFAQAEDERTRRFGGAGLGLAISRLLARAMGGELQLAETGPEGSVFRLTLPLPVSLTEREKDSTSTTFTLQRLAVSEPGGVAQILVVDDNPANRYVVEAYLQELGIRAVLAESADEGLAALARQSFDLVLMDVQMPGKDGYQATQEIRNRLGLDLPVVAMTANANIGERARCEAAGMNDLLVKPFDAGALVDLLNRNLSLAAADRARAGSVLDHGPPGDGAEPLLDVGSAGSIVQRFTGKPATLRKLYSALQESIAMHLDAIRTARASESPSVAAALHGLKGAAGMYGARRLQVESRSLEERIVGGASVGSLAAGFDRLELTGRETVDAVHRLLESLAAADDTAGT